MMGQVLPFKRPSRAMRIVITGQAGITIADGARMHSIAAPGRLWRVAWPWWRRLLVRKLGWKRFELRVPRSGRLLVRVEEASGDL